MCPPPQPRQPLCPSPFQRPRHRQELIACDGRQSDVLMDVRPTSSRPGRPAILSWSGQFSTQVTTSASSTGETETDSHPSFYHGHVALMSLMSERDHQGPRDSNALGRQGGACCGRQPAAQVGSPFVGCTQRESPHTIHAGCRVWSCMKGGLVG